MHDTLFLESISISDVINDTLFLECISISDVIIL